MYYIYHIPGIKIGCTTNLKNRMAQLNYTEYEVLEEHLDGWIAGDRELELQKEYGYDIDPVHYMIKLRQLESGRTKESYERAAQKTKGVKLSDEQKYKLSQAGMGNQNAKGAIRSEETRKKLSDAHMGSTVSLETKSKISETMKGMKRPRVICPHCKKPGANNLMIRYHFDNCKHKS